MSAVPIPDPTLGRARKQIVLEGDVPNPINPPSGCWFHPRCPRFHAGICDVETRRIVDVRRRARGACHYPLERWPLTRRRCDAGPPSRDRAARGRRAETRRDRVDGRALTASRLRDVKGGAWTVRPASCDRAARVGRRCAWTASSREFEAACSRPSAAAATPARVTRDECAALSALLRAAPARASSDRRPAQLRPRRAIGWRRPAAPPRPRVWPPSASGCGVSIPAARRAARARDGRRSPPAPPASVVDRRRRDWPARVCRAWSRRSSSARAACAARAPSRLSAVARPYAPSRSLQRDVPAARLVLLIARSRGPRCGRPQTLQLRSPRRPGSRRARASIDSGRSPAAALR